MKNYIYSLILLFILNGGIYAQNSDNVTGFYSGKIGKKLNVTLSLKQTGNEIRGYYHYDKKNIDIPIYGRLDSSGIVYFEEYEYFGITGFWNGKLNEDKLSGTWTSEDEKRVIPFECKKITKDGTAGEPMSTQVTFGEGAVSLEKNDVTVPVDIAEKLIAFLIENEELEPEYDADVIKKGKDNPSVMFTGENVDLNNDKIPELVVYPSGSEGLCKSHNCRFWIFEKNKDGYKQILSGVAGIFGYLVLNVRENNFFDIALIQHASAIDHDYEVYRFNGNEYKLYRCFLETGNETDNGDINYSYKEHDCSD